MPDVGDIPVERLLAALYPTPLPQGDAACASPHSAFDFDANLQQLVFYGELTEPGLVTRARRICDACPMLQACRSYATESCEDHVILGGLTAQERLTRRRKKDIIRLRQRQVAELLQLGLGTAQIAELLDVHVTVIRAAVRAIRAACPSTDGRLA